MLLTQRIVTKADQQPLRGCENRRTCFGFSSFDIILISIVIVMLSSVFGLFSGNTGEVDHLPL